MSDALATALARLAKLDQEMAELRSRSAPQGTPGIDPRAFLQDPVGALTRAGIPIDHVTRVLVANAMGDQAPPELRTLAAQGPLLSKQSEIEAKLEAVSRQLVEITTPKKPTAESVQALISDAKKYPVLSKAAALDPDLITEALATHGGTAEELAAKLEARFSKLMPATPAASEANADVSTGQSTQANPAGNTTSGGVPPIPKQNIGGTFTQEDHAKLRDEIVRKHSSQQG